MDGLATVDSVVKGKADIVGIAELLVLVGIQAIVVFLVHQVIQDIVGCLVIRVLVVPGKVAIAVSVG